MKVLRLPTEKLVQGLLTALVLGIIAGFPTFSDVAHGLVPDDGTPVVFPTPPATSAPVPNLAEPQTTQIVVDDQDSGFSLGGPSNGWHHSGSGDTTYNGHAYWTYTTDTWYGSNTNDWATWTPNLPSSGQWEVFAYIPNVNTGRYDTTRARYQIYTAGGDYVVERNQNDNNGWVSLGVFTFNAGTSGYIRLEDVTPDWSFIYNGQRYRKTIKFDAIRWVSLGGSPPPVGGRNLVLNSSFEQASSDPNRDAANWDSFAYTEWTTVAHSGSRGALTEGNPWGMQRQEVNLTIRGWWSDPISVVPGQRYYFGFWHKRHASTSYYAQAMVLNNVNDVLLNVVKQTSDSWAYGEQSLVIPSGITQIIIWLPGPSDADGSWGTRGGIDYDDIWFSTSPWSGGEEPPEPVSVDIWVDRGEGATYYVGETLTMCYSVSRPIYINIWDCPPGQSCQPILQGNDDGRGDCRNYTVTLPTGREVLRIEAIENGQVLAQDETYFYVESEPCEDNYEPDDSHSQANWISVDGSGQTHRFCDAGDHDWVKFSASTGYEYTIKTYNLGSESDTYLYLYDTDGRTQIIHDDDGGDESRASKIVWTAPQSGTYYAMVRHFDDSESGPDTNYDISITATALCTPGANGVVLYEHPNYEGRCITLTADDPDLNDNNFNDIVSSIKFVGSYSGAYAVTLYEHTWYYGASSIFTGDDPDLGNDTIGHDRASSIYLRPIAKACTGDGVYLYEHPNYIGRCTKFTGDDPDFGNENFHDMASAIKFIGRYATGYEAILYEHPDYQGVSSTFRNNDPDFGNDDIGHDRASSIRIRQVPQCHTDPYEPNNDFSSASVIQPGNDYYSYICPQNDEDYFRITNDVPVGSEVRVSLTNLPADYDIWLYNALMFPIGSSTNRGTADELITTNIAGAPPLYVKVTGFQGAYHTSTSYHLRVEVRRPPDIDLGFRPDPDGFGFNNIETTRTAEMFVQFFGRNAVCPPSAQCDVTRPETWRQAARDEFAGYAASEGSCDGFSATALLNFSNLEQPASGEFAMPFYPNLYSVALNDGIRNAIAFQQGYWYSAEISPGLISGCSQEFPQPSSFYNRIKEALGNGEAIILSFWDPERVCPPLVECFFDAVAHSVVPYRIDESVAGKVKVYVYDSNAYGNHDLFFEFDLSNYRWKYAWPLRPDTKGDSRCTDGTSGLLIMSLDHRLRPGIPTWNTNNIILAGASNADQHQAGNQSLKDSSQTGTNLVLRPSKSWLPLIRDQNGRRLGWVNGEMVNEIPDAYYFAEPQDSVEDLPPKSFYLPIGQRYAISLIALGGPADFRLIHSGGSMTLKSENENPGATTEVMISSDGLSLEVSSSGTLRKMSVLIAGEQSDGSVVAEAREVTVGETGTFKLNLMSNGQVSVVNSGVSRTFELGLHRISLNSGTFIHSGITIGANDTGVVQVSDWNNLSEANVQLQIDQGSDGTIDQTVSLENEARERWLLQPGWNLIAIPGNPQPQQDAESLSTLINNAGGHVTAILSWDGSGWQAYQIGLPFGDFPIWSATGYFVYSTRSSEFTIMGVRPPDEVFIQLRRGWNIIGVPLGSYTAESMLQDILRQGGDATTVLRWDGSGWQAHQIGLPFGDFGLEQNEGYFVYSTQNSLWRPNQ